MTKLLMLVTSIAVCTSLYLSNPSYGSVCFTTASCNCPHFELISNGYCEGVVKSERVP